MENNSLLINEFNYINNLNEINDENIIFSDTNKTEIKFISLDLIFSKLNENNYKNININKFLKYLVYQKNELFSTEILLNIIDSLFNNNLINFGLIILNNYILNYYKSEICNNIKLQLKIKILYEKIQTQKISFFNNEINIQNLINILISNPPDYKSLFELTKIPLISYEKENNSMIPNSNSSDLLKNWNEIEIARQLTLISYFIYKNIQCFELLSLNWKKENKKNLCPNLILFLNRYNILIRFFSEEILSYDKIVDRVDVIKKILLIIKSLYTLNNFNDIIILIHSFCHPSIKRLLKTWEKLDDKNILLLSNLSILCKNFNNFENIQKEFEKYKNNINNNDNNNDKEGCINYLGIYLQKLINEEEKNKDYIIIKNNIKLINIEKIMNVGKIIEDFQDSQNYNYNYKIIFGLSKLAEPQILTDEELMNLSENLEPIFLLKEKESNEKRENNKKRNNSLLNGIFNSYIKEENSYKKNSMSLSEILLKRNETKKIN